MSQLKKTARRGRIMGNWTEESMKEAIKEVQKGNDSIRKIGDRYKIPASSIRDWMSGKTSSKKKGPRTVLSKEEEDSIVEWCLKNQQISRGITFYMLRKKVADVCKGRETPFKDGVPGKRWLEWFRKRHPSVVIEPAHALKGKKRPESEREVLAAKRMELSPPPLLAASDRSILAVDSADRDMFSSTLGEIPCLDDHDESHVMLTQNELKSDVPEEMVESESETLKGETMESEGSFQLLIKGKGHGVDIEKQSIGASGSSHGCGSNGDQGGSSTSVVAGETVLQIKQECQNFHMDQQTVAHEQFASGYVGALVSIGESLPSLAEPTAFLLPTLSP